MTPPKSAREFWIRNKACCPRTALLAPPRKKIWGNSEEIIRVIEHAAYLELLEQARKLREALDTCQTGDYSTGHVVDPTFDEEKVFGAIEAFDEWCEKVGVK